ncbi:RING-H2 finger protein ATL56 [Platanthera guangdongensis]|uniref:RING-H2 finger protein ATL56 n=1 Tax=Platanthera guangdongensis TaxID=2320717 RepID=A0ABR2M1K6_9ASPA
MDSEICDESMPILHRRRRPAGTIRFPLEKPGGARLLSFFLRIVVMAIALALFFLFAGIAVFTLIFLCVIGRVLRRRQLIESVIRPPQAAVRRGLSQEEMRLLSCFSYAGVIPSECAVCLEELREGELCRALPGCNHVFHRPCVDRWLERSEMCPICRGDVTVGHDDPNVLQKPLGWI